MVHGLACRCTPPRGRQYQPRCCRSARVAPQLWTAPWCCAETLKVYNNAEGSIWLALCMRQRVSVHCPSSESPVRAAQRPHTGISIGMKMLLSLAQEDQPSTLSSSAGRLGGLPAWQAAATTTPGRSSTPPHLGGTQSSPLVVTSSTLGQRIADQHGDSARVPQEDARHVGNDNAFGERTPYRIARDLHLSPAASMNAWRSIAPACREAPPSKYRSLFVVS